MACRAVEQGVKMSHARALRLITISLWLLMVGSRDANAVQPNPHATTATAITTGPTSLKLDYHDSEDESKRMLAELGFKRNTMAAVIRWFFDPLTFIVVAALLTAAALAGDWFFATRNKQLDLNLGSRVLAVSVLLAVFQWNASLEQDAMQRYESEITNANSAESSEAVASMFPNLYRVNPGEEPKASHEKTRYVYTSLDNLEYAVERYRQGFASASTTERAVMTFVEHCKESDFRKRARCQVKGYSKDVKAVVENVVNIHCRETRCEEQTSLDQCSGRPSEVLLFQRVTTSR